MRRLCWFTLGLAGAVCVFLLWKPEGAALIPGIAALMLSLAGFRFGGMYLRRTAVSLLGLAVGFVWCFGYQTLFLRPLRTIPEDAVSITAEAAEYPRTAAYGYSVVAKLEVGNRRYQSVLYFDEETDLEPGDRITCLAKLTPAEKKLEDDNFYYSSRGVWLIASCRGELKAEKAEKRQLRYLPAYANRTLRESCAAVFPADAVPLMQALLLGEKSGLSYADKNDLSIAGIYHAVAVSGMHVSILLGIILLLCGSRRRLAAAIGLPVIVFFVLMTGAPASAVRAGIMQSLLLLAPLLGRENDPATSLCAALTLLLLENPWSMQNVGLQLSFTSTAGILLFAAPIYRLFAGRKRMQKRLAQGGVFGWLLRAMLVAAATSFAATAFSMPFAAWQFEVLSLAAPVTNMLCLWAMTVLFSAGMVLCVFGLLAAPFAAGAAWLLSWLCRYVWLVVRLIAKIPYAALYFENVYSIILGCFLYLCLILFAVRPEVFRKPLVSCSILAAAMLCLSAAALDYRLPSCCVSALDVGQGQCMVLHATGKTTVVDCGGDSEESGEIAARFLQSRGEFRVENLVLTHFDADHCNGAVQLLNRERVERLYLPQTEDESGLRETILAAAENRKTTVYFVENDQTLPDCGAEITVFGSNPGKNSNETCLCVLASAGKYDILITGDLPEQAEYRMMSTHDLPDLEVLVAGHHGAKTSTSAALLEQTQPETILVSVGKGNSFGHPSQEMLERAAQIGAKVCRTDECGSITIRIR